MGELQNNNIARNTVTLYFRHIITLFISLSTSRVVLRVLGVEDYGIFNVVSGIVTLFSFFEISMNSAFLRFLSFEIPKGDGKKLGETFGIIKFSFVVVVVSIFVITEIFGLWFLNNYLIIPQERLVAANWVFQLSVLAYIAEILATPYRSLIISHEQMSIYAYISVFDAFIRLLLVFLLQYIAYDSLVIYAFMMFFGTTSVTFVYRWYSRRYFEESRYPFSFNKNRLVEINSFAFWNMLCPLTNVLRNQGVNILINVFFNPSINAARAVSYQVSGAVSRFTTNIFTAVNPQIVKRYSVGELNKMHTLLIQSSRFAFYFMSILIVPIILHADYLLKLWLVNPPEYASLFVKLVLITSLMEILSEPLLTGVQATGKLKMFNVIVSSIYLLNLPICWIFLKNGWPPESTVYINMLLVVAAIIPKLIICNRYFKLPIWSYLLEVIIWCSFITFVSFWVGYFTLLFISSIHIIGDFAAFVICLVETIGVIFLLGLKNREKKSVLCWIEKRVR